MKHNTTIYDSVVKMPHYCLLLLHEARYRSSSYDATVLVASVC